MIKMENIQGAENEQNMPVENGETVETTKTTQPEKMETFEPSFNDRFVKAISKHLPSTNEMTEGEALSFLKWVARQINNHFPDMRMIETIEQVKLVAAGKIESEAILKAIEDMPEGGYGY